MRIQDEDEESAKLLRQRIRKRFYMTSVINSPLSPVSLSLWHKIFTCPSAHLMGPERCESKSNSGGRQDSCSQLAKDKIYSLNYHFIVKIL